MTTFRLNDTTIMDIIRSDAVVALVFFDESEDIPHRCGSVILDNDAYDKLKEILP